MQTQTFKSTHFDEGIHVLHDDLAVRQAFWSNSEESRRHDFEDYCTTKGRDSRCGSSIISQLDFALNMPLDLCPFFGNSDFEIMILSI